MLDLSRRWGRRRGSTLAVAVLTMLVVTAPVRPAAALEAGPEGTAKATQDGWWNRLQGPQEGEPEGNPVRPLVPAVPPPPTVPGDAIAVAVAAGQPVLVAAVGIEIALPAGALVESLRLILKEAPSGNVNAQGAKVLACPATAPWGPAKNAAWRDRPEVDCSLAVVNGERAEDGTWTFDLTDLASQWTGSFAAAPLGQNGVVLGIDAVASPGPTQVAWSDIETGNVVVELAATPGIPAGFESSPSPGFAESGAPSTEAPSTEAASTEVTDAAPEFLPAPGTTFSDPLAFPTGQPTFTNSTPVATGAPAPEATTALVATPAGPAPVTGTLQAQPAVGFWEDIPVSTVLLLPVALGLALLVGLTLGPGGRPLPTWPRAGGLSRALARRRPGGDAVA
ncbi:MAG: hypothetical protein M3357_11880 [Actinomycetota bacterium]|nr:hypothetical protein [Actinomycetota bacterium]